MSTTRSRRIPPVLTATLLALAALLAVPAAVTPAQAQSGGGSVTSITGYGPVKGSGTPGRPSGEDSSTPCCNNRRRTASGAQSSEPANPCYYNPATQTADDVPDSCYTYSSSGWMVFRWADGWTANSIHWAGPSTGPGCCPDPPRYLDWGSPCGTSYADNTTPGGGETTAVVLYWEAEEDPAPYYGPGISGNNEVAVTTRNYSCRAAPPPNIVNESYTCTWGGSAYVAGPYDNGETPPKPAQNPLQTLDYVASDFQDSYNRDRMSSRSRCREGDDMRFTSSGLRDLGRYRLVVQMQAVSCTYRFEQHWNDSSPRENDFSCSGPYAEPDRPFLGQRWCGGWDADTWSTPRRFDWNECSNVCNPADGPCSPAPIWFCNMTTTAFLTRVDGAEPPIAWRDRTTSRTEAARIAGDGKEWRMEFEIPNPTGAGVTNLGNQVAELTVSAGSQPFRAGEDAAAPTQPFVTNPNPGEPVPYAGSWPNTWTGRWYGPSTMDDDGRFVPPGSPRLKNRPVPWYARADYTFDADFTVQYDQDVTQANTYTGSWGATRQTFTRTYRSNVTCSSPEHGVYVEKARNAARN